jgi:diguanylate cyclase (GGDEF)-like protein
VAGLLCSGVCPSIEHFLYQGLADFGQLTSYYSLPVWLVSLLFLAVLGLGIILTRWQFLYRLGVWITLDALWIGFCILRLKNGLWTPMLVTLLLLGLNVGLTVIFQFGQTCLLLHQTDSALEKLQLQDPLTCLPNQTCFIQHLQQLIEDRPFPSLQKFAVLWLDLDRFHLVNNSFDRKFGDQLLLEVAQRLRTLVSCDNCIARMGEDEFALLLNPLQSPEQANQMAEHIQHLLSQPFHLDGREVVMTVSIGIVCNEAHYTEAEHLLRDANTATHRAKTRGPSRYAIFDHSMRTHLLARLQLESDLRQAITPSQESLHPRWLSLPYLPHPPIATPAGLTLHYQPIVKLATGQIRGFEALVRWYHPEQGFLAPEQFIATAEETGLIVPLGWWLIRSACQQMQQWKTISPQIPPLTMSVNLSSQQFTLPNFAEQLHAILQDTALEPQLLKLEITESSLMENAVTVLETLHRTRALGVQLAIDDFGTGYSSLSYLANFPINTLKIDRSFLNRGGKGDRWEIVRTILELAHALGMDATAEGVEALEQVTQLLKLNCEYGQGYFFSKPLEAEAITQLLQQQANLRVLRP